MAQVKGKEFEEVILYRVRQECELGRVIMGRYGVQGSFSKGKPFTLDYYERQLETLPGQTSRILRELVEAAKASADGWRPLQSLPDFEGLIPPRGTQFITDAKVCGKPSFDLREQSTSASRQLRHMLERDKFGAICFYAIHFTPRELAGGIQDAETWAFPVSASHPFWEAFDRGEQKRITREDCREYGVPIEWNCLPGGRTERPDIVMAIYELAAKLGKGKEVEVEE